jgi:protein-L-isoaspartate(D-aspartate) O-methyltransferase
MPAAPAAAGYMFGGRIDWRARLVAAQFRARGVADPRVLAAMLRVPREQFVPDALRHEAFEDRPLPIGHGQTISQPYIVGYMTEALKLQPSHRVLEIGAGCGYQTAVLAELAGEIYSVELIDDLAERARAMLAQLGYSRVHVRAGDGHAGWPEHAPFDRIVAAAAPAAVPPALVEQLADGGILVIPVGESVQELRVLQKHGGAIELLETLPVRFVPMVRKPD